ncbi:MAG: hypothetical protein IPM57_09270 [Oligoflexia bacterium]|nr:hypothetical protein [Oligoflexia bacterium]
MAFGFVFSNQSLAFFVREVEPGIVELKSTQDGSLDKIKTFLDKKQKWLYIEIKEGNQTRYFYALAKDFIKLSEIKKLTSIQFGVGNRIQNNKGKIPFGAQRYFYPILDYKS